MHCRCSFTYQYQSQKVLDGDDLVGDGGMVVCMIINGLCEGVCDSMCAGACDGLCDDVGEGVGGCVSDGRI